MYATVVSSSWQWYRTLLHAQVLNFEERIVLLEESKEQKDKLAAEKKEKKDAKDLAKAAYVWELQLFKRLGFTPEGATDITVAHIDKFADVNIPTWKADVKRDGKSTKPKANKLAALQLHTRLQHGDGHWKDANGTPAPCITVPPAVLIAPGVVSEEVPRASIEEGPVVVIETMAGPFY